MKKIILSIFALTAGFYFTSCNNIKDENSDQVEEMTQETTIHHESNEVYKLDVEKFSKYKNNYPAEVDFFQDENLSMRLAELLQDDYEDMKKYWNVETPIVIEDNILYTTGCEQHNCPANQFILIIDLEKDNINVFRLGETSMEYEEKGTIRLPNEIEKEFQMIMDNSII